MAAARPLRKARLFRVVPRAPSAARLLRPAPAPLPASSCSPRLASRTPALRACSCRGPWRRSWRRRRRSGPRTGSCGQPARWRWVSGPGPGRAGQGAGDPLGTLERTDSSVSGTGRAKTRGKPLNICSVKFWSRCETGGAWSCYFGFEKINCGF